MKKPLESTHPQVLFGQQVIRLRKRLGWSQEHLAHLSGLGRSYVGSVERGERNISLLNICVLAQTLEVKLTSLMDFDVVSKP